MSGHARRTQPGVQPGASLGNDIVGQPGSTPPECPSFLYIPHIDQIMSIPLKFFFFDFPHIGTPPIFHLKLEKTQKKIVY